VKVLMATHSLEAGGAERQLALLAVALCKEIELKVWTFGGGPFADVLRDKGIDVLVHEKKGRFDLRPGLSLIHTILNFRPDIIHSWSWLASLYCVATAKLLHIPIIDGQIRMGRMLGKCQYRVRIMQMLSDRVIANSEAGLNAWKVPKEKGIVIHNAFDAHRVLDSRKYDYGFEGTVIVMAARIVPEKDFRTFMSLPEYVSRLDRKGRYLFVAIGDGEDRKKLSRWKQETINAKCISLGFRKEVVPYLKGANIGLLLTNTEVHAEGCSNSVLEYMACGLPVIATDSGGTREVILDGVNGVLIPSGNSSLTIAKAIVSIASNRSIYNTMSSNNINLIGRAFSIERMVYSYLSVYESLLRDL